MDGRNMIRALWDFVIETIKTIGIVWDWLLTNHYIGLKIDWLGVDFGFNVLPIGVTGVAMVALLVFAFIKDFVPVA